MKVLINKEGLTLIPQNYLERQYIRANPEIRLVATNTTYKDKQSVTYTQENKNNE